MKKLLSLLLVLIIVLSMFTGCGKTETPTTKEEPKAEEPANEESNQEEAAPSWQEEHPTWLCEEKTTLHVYTYDGANATYLPPSNDLWFWQQVEDYTNVHIEWEIVPYADYETLVQAKMAAGGDMPDILNVRTKALDFGSTGLLLDMAPYWDTCFTKTQAYFDSVDVPFKQTVTLTEAGEIFGIPEMSPIKTQNIRTFMFNKLWMDKLGLKDPTSIDELTEVLRAMKAAGDLNENGVDDEIILTASSVNMLLACTSAAFGIDVLDGARYGVDENGVAFPWYTTENQRAQLEWLNLLYEEGILDPEITAMNADLMSQKIAADKLGVAGYYSSFIQNYSQLTSAGQADPMGQYYVVAEPMTSEFCDEAFTIIYESYSNFTAVTADCEYPELACKWIDTLYSDPVVTEWRRLGPEGECWEMVDGEITPIFDEEGKQVSERPFGAGQLALCWRQPEENYAYKWTRPWYLEDYKPFAEGLWKFSSVPVTPGKTEFEKELHDTYFTDVNDGFNEFRDKFITGELDINSDDDWNNFVETMDALGMNELTAEFQSIYDRKNTAG